MAWMDDDKQKEFHEPLLDDMRLAEFVEPEDRLVLAWEDGSSHEIAVLEVFRDGSARVGFPPGTRWVEGS